MSWTIQVRAVHQESGRLLEEVIESCPALLGRDPLLSACPLIGDERVSKGHVSLDVRGRRLMARDEGSTNGTFVQERRMEARRWTDLGAVEDEIVLRLAGWMVYVRARETHTLSSGARTDADGMPFGASQSQTVELPDGERFTSFDGAVSRISERAMAAREAMAALRIALDAELGNVGVGHRGDLARALESRYPELREDVFLREQLRRWAPESDVSPTSPAATEALSVVREVARRYVGTDEGLDTKAGVRALGERVKDGVDEMLTGIVRLVRGVDAYGDQMQVDAATPDYPREPVSFARAIFDWRDGTRDGAQVIRSAILDVVVHQLGAVQATTRGVQDLLAEFAPSRLEEQWRGRVAKETWWRRALARCARSSGILEMYRILHLDLTSEGEEATWFRVLFGRRFAEEYRAFALEARAASVDPPSVSGSSEPSAHGTVFGSRPEPRAGSNREP